MDDLEARTIGEQLRRIRKARNKSLRVIGGLAGMSASSLSRIENGLRALDSRAETVALANALGVAPSELTRMPELAPGGGEGPAVKTVRRALIAVTRDGPARTPERRGTPGQRRRRTGPGAAELLCRRVRVPRGEPLTNGCGDGAGGLLRRLRFEATELDVPHPAESACSP